jgi:aspartate/methionine/tyrosine aminotransferase
MNPIAKDLNQIISEANDHVYEMLSDVGKNLFFPKGILSQSAEAKEKAHRFNATIGMATEKGRTMHLPSIMSMIKGIQPEDSLTYAPSFGVKQLRERWKEDLMGKNPTLKGKDISLPVVSNAITHGLSVVADMWVDPGDAIILPDKMWGNYNLIFSVRRGADIINYPLFEGGTGFNLKALESCVKKETEKREKLIVILNFPNNPTGYSINEKEAEGIVRILKNAANSGKNVIAITDDAYFGLFYDDETMKESIFGKLCGANERLLAIKLDGATKEDFVWGLRVGFITYGASFKGDPSLPYDALERKTAGAVRGSISNASRLSQEIILRALDSDAHKSERRDKFNIMTGRAKMVKKVLSDPKYSDAWEPYPFNSGYFMCLRLKTVEAEKLRVHLLEKYGVGLISLGKTDLRVAFSCLEEGDVGELFDTVLRGIKDLEGK